MDFEAYRRAHYVDPQPESRFGFGSIRGATLYFADYPAAVEFYSVVLGEPAYVEGSGTRGWRLGDSWLTLLAGGPGAPTAVEIAISMTSPAEAERRLRRRRRIRPAAVRSADVRAHPGVPGHRPVRDGHHDLRTALIPAESPAQVAGNGSCTHHGTSDVLIDTTHLTHQKPRRPGAAMRAGKP